MLIDNFPAFWAVICVLLLHIGPYITPVVGKVSSSACSSSITEGLVARENHFPTATPWRSSHVAMLGIVSYKFIQFNTEHSMSNKAGEKQPSLIVGAGCEKDENQYLAIITV